jgi:hypothetical protein
MRGLRSTIILFVVLVALGAYLYFVESKRPASSEAVETKDKVFDVEGDKIVEFQVRASNGDTTTVKRSGADWQIVGPPPLKADQSTVSGITTNLATLEIQRVIDEAPKSLDQYALTKPLVEVTFRTDADKTPRKLMIGEKTPTGGDVYAMRGNDKRVFLIPAYLEGTFNRNSFDLRDKAVLSFSRGTLDSIELKGAGPTVRAVKQNAEWRLAEPWAARADFGTLESLIGRLETTQIKSVVADTAAPTDLKKYGLEPPAVSVTVGSGSSRATLQVGSAADETSVYVRDVSRPSIFTVEKAFADELKKPAADFRRKDVFDFRPFNANKVQVVRDGKTFAFEKTKGTGKDATAKWQEVAPTRRDIDEEKFETFLARLSNLRATGFEETARGAAPVAEILVSYEDGKKEDRVTLSKSATDGFAIHAGEPGAGKIETNALNDLINALDASLAPAKPAAAAQPK